jgi:hypothetical protein
MMKYERLHTRLTHVSANRGRFNLVKLKVLQGYCRGCKRAVPSLRFDQGIECIDIQQLLIRQSDLHLLMLRVSEFYESAAPGKV